MALYEKAVQLLDARPNLKDIAFHGIRYEPIWRALGKEKAQALPIFHAFTGADNVGKFSRIAVSTVHEG